MLSRYLIVGLIALGVPSAAWIAGIRPAGADQEEPKEEEFVYPGEEFKKLSYFVGSWSGEMKITPDPHGEGGLVKAQADFERILDGHCFTMTYAQQPTKDQQRVFKGFAVLTWDLEERMYHLWWFDNFGGSRDATGTWKDDTLAFKFGYFWEQTAVEEMITFGTASPKEYKFEIKSGFAGKPMATRMKGTLTKQS